MIAEKVLICIAFYLMLFLAAVSDAIKDSIDHKKGAETLYGFWHLMKHLLRIETFAVGCLFVLLITRLSCSLERYIFIVLILFHLLTLKDFIWMPIYKSSLWKILDNTWIIKTGWKWFDKQLGFDKQPPKG